MYAAALNGAGTNAIGIGTNLASVAQQFTQGNIKTTENPMDLSINGAGFFQVTDGKSPVTFTRNGQFKVDKDGLHRQQLAAEAHGLRGRRHGADPARPGRAAAAAHRSVHRSRPRDAVGDGAST